MLEIEKFILQYWGIKSQFEWTKLVRLGLFEEKFRIWDLWKDSNYWILAVVFDRQDLVGFLENLCFFKLSLTS